MRRDIWRFAGPAVALTLLLAGCDLDSSPQPDESQATLPSTSGTAATTTTVGSTTPPTTGVGSTPYETQAAMQLGLAGATTNWNLLAARPAAADPNGALVTVSDAVLPSAFVTGPTGAKTSNAQLLLSATETPASSTKPETVVYDLDPRAVWSDGTPITGADFVYTWEAQSGRSTFRDLGGRAFTPESTAGYADISSVRTTSGRADQVVVTFAHPYAGWQSLFDPILPAHVATKVGFDHGFTDPVTSLVSGGPFLVQSYQPGAGIRLVRNPRWWGPAANLASIDVSFVDNPGAGVAALRSSQLDATVGTLDGPALNSAETTTGLSASVTSSGLVDDLVADTHGGALGQRALRLALWADVDRAAIAAAARRAGDPDAASPATPPADQPGAPGATRAALRRSGFRKRKGRLWFGGHPVRLTLGVATATPFAAAEKAAIAAAATRLGISLTTLTTASGTEATRVAAGRYDLAVVGAPAASFPKFSFPLIAEPSVLTYQNRYVNLTPNPAGIAWNVASWGILAPA